MTDQSLAARAAELLRTCLYANVATANNGQPWNTPVLAVSDSQFNLYWSSWHRAVHSVNLAENPNTFLTLYDSTRARGSNNLRCLYLQCLGSVVTEEAEAKKAFELIYPGETMNLADFYEPGLKRFYKAIPQRAWLNCLSERDLTPATIKMREEVPLELLRAAL
jgi:hypothetical protein